MMHIPGTCPKYASTFALHPRCFPNYEPVIKRIQPGMVPAANYFLSLSNDDSYGDQFTFSVGKSEFMARIEYHCHNPGEKGPQGYHRGITVYNKKL